MKSITKITTLRFVSEWATHCATRTYQDLIQLLKRYFHFQYFLPAVPPEHVKVPGTSRHARHPRRPGARGVPRALTTPKPPRPEVRPEVVPYEPDGARGAAHQPVLHQLLVLGRQFLRQL